jgi:hypothetical protein
VVIALDRCAPWRACLGVVVTCTLHCAPASTGWVFVAVFKV